jgi:hypothetical protein
VVVLHVRPIAGSLPDLPLSAPREERSGERHDPSASKWSPAIGATTLFVEDLAVSTEFYQRTFDLDAVFEDEQSAVFRFGDQLICSMASGEAIP